RIRAGHFAIPADAAVSYPARALIHGLLRRDPLERPSAEALLALPWLAAKDSTVSAASVVVVQTVRGRKGVVLTNNAEDQLVPSVDLDQLFAQVAPPLPSSSPNPTAE
uniref:Uncharacterized protein n=1 Tax=Plectus sambesii TaxID=2011161 RepID=A0A914X6U8_9BILA